MLNLKKLKKQWRVVKCKIPMEGSDTGFGTVEFRALFKLLTMDQFSKVSAAMTAASKKLKDSIEKGEGGTDEEAQKQAVSFLDEVLLDVKDVEVEDGEDAMDLAKRTIWPMKAMVEHYMKMMQGIEEDNLKKSPD